MGKILSLIDFRGENQEKKRSPTSFQGRSRKNLKSGWFRVRRKHMLHMLYCTGKRIIARSRHVEIF